MTSRGDQQDHAGQRRRQHVVEGDVQAPEDQPQQQPHPGEKGEGGP